MQDFEQLQNFLNATLKWLEHVKSIQVISDPENLSWAAYHASNSAEKKQHPNLSALLLVLRDEAKSPTMIKHSLEA